MLQNQVIAQDLPEDGCCLIDHGGEGNGIDDAREAVPARVVEREAEGGERLPAAGWHREREQASRLACLSAHMGQDLCPQPVYRGWAALSLFALHVRVEAGDQLVDDGGQLRPFSITLPSLDLVVEGFRVAKVGIYETREDHPAQKGELEANPLGVELNGRQEIPQIRRKLFLPLLVERLEGLLQALGQSCAGAYPVRQARVMSRDRISNEFGRDPVTRIS